VSGVKAAFVGHEAPKHVTMLPVVSAAGKLLVMIFIIEGVRLMSKYCEAWPEAVFLMTASGGIDNDCWPSIMKTVVERAPKPSCLLVDGHKVHCNNLATIEHAAEKKVGMVQGVAHLTHKTQALDVGGFPAFNQKYDEIKTAAMMDGATPDPANSIAWAKKAWEAITIDGVIPGIKNAFKKIGVYPWNPDAFTDDDFEAAALHGKIVGDLRAAADLPRSPEAIVTEAFGPPLPPSMIKSAIEQHSTLSTGSVLLTGAQHMSKMAADLIHKAQEAGVKEAAAAARKAKKAQKDEENAVKKAEREAKKEAKAAAAASAAAAPRAKKRARSESEPPVAKKGKKAGAAPAPAAPEPAAPRVDVRPGKRTRILKPTDD
jgi:hypothetical protein